MLLPLCCHGSVVIGQTPMLQVKSCQSSNCHRRKIRTLGLSPYTPFMLLGIRIDPPRSVPQPISDPFIARRAPSPPVDPPHVSDGSRGLTVRPHSGLIVSTTCSVCHQSRTGSKERVAPTMMLWGTFVFAIMTAPKRRIMLTMVASSLAGENALPTYPRVESKPLTLNWSLRETGSPWKGPIGFPSRWKCSSSSRERWRASSKRTSVRQFVCAVRLFLCHSGEVLTFLCASMALPYNIGQRVLLIPVELLDYTCGYMR